MIDLPYTHECIRLTGRWDTRDPHAAVTGAAGSYFEFAFRGTMALIKFDILTNSHPYLHLWVQLDGGDRVEVVIDAYLRVQAKTAGDHVCRVIFNGCNEHGRRWVPPLTEKVSFVGLQVEEAGVLPPDGRPTIEFVGDSISKGVLIDADYNSGGEALPTYVPSLSDCYMEDVCATYAYLTAEALDLRPLFMAYGGLGVIRGATGGVPYAAKAYPFHFASSPLTRPAPDYILINLGANDAGRPVEQYLQAYGELLDVIRSHNPHVKKIFALSAFCGAHHEALGSFIADYNRRNDTNIVFLDSTGWIPKEPLHPLRDGHKTVAAHLIPLLSSYIIKE